MKILLLCAGGMSTSILMKRMETYWTSKGIALDIKAVGIGVCQDYASDFDICMVGPQVAHRVNEVKDLTGLPTAPIQSLDYAIGNCDNIMKLANTLYSEK